MSVDTYQLKPGDIHLSHGRSPAQLLHDYEGSESPLEIVAQIASGDMFITLATILDDALQEIDADSQAHFKVEKVTSTLIYLQHNHYKITRNK